MPYQVARNVLTKFSCMLIFSTTYLHAQQSTTFREALWALGPFTRVVHAPVIRPRPESVFTDPVSGDSVHWEALYTFNPAATVYKGRIIVLYRAEDNTGTMSLGGHTSRLGLAESKDGIHFKRLPEPVFYPARDSQEQYEMPGGVEDPRIVENEDGMYVLTYTQWARNLHSYTVGVATSLDLRHWKKRGQAFGHEGKYTHFNYKSAAILTMPVRGRLLAAKVNGKYWMYWGESPIRIATSTDLIHWHPLEDPTGNPLVVLDSRPGLFDSAFPESGPPPILTKNGIVVLYNAKNATSDGAPDLAPGTYSTGQALFSSTNPTKLLYRMNKPFLEPKESYEKSGQYAAGTTFAEGLVLFHRKWFLYYGCADSFVGVVMYDPKGEKVPEN